jgi:microcystin-dependent protein
MLARLIHDLTKGRLRLPLRTGVSTTKGDLRLDDRVPRLVSNETTARDMRLLTDLDLDTPGNPPALRADGTLDPTIIPAAASSGATAGGELVGEIKAWAGHPLRVPQGWLACDGLELPIVAYPALFDALGYLWGRPSNAALYFKLPDLVGRVLIGGLGPNDSATGRTHKINVRSPGANYVPGTYTGLTLLADAPAAFSTAATVTVTVGAGGGVDSVDIVSGGQVANVQPSADPTTAESNCSIRIPVTSIPGGAGFTYDVYLAPTTVAAQAWGVSMTLRGAGYTAAPSVVLSGPSLVGATAVAVLAGSTVREIIVTNPGTGAPAGATATLSGGGFSVAATAAVVTWTSPSVAGDMGGEQQHTQLVTELAEHAHTNKRGNSFRERSGGVGVFQDGTPNMPAGGGLSAPLLPPYAGVTYVVRAS